MVVAVVSGGWKESQSVQHRFYGASLASMPFPLCVIDDFLPPVLLEALQRDYPAADDFARGVAEWPLDGNLVRTAPRCCTR